MSAFIPNTGSILLPCNEVSLFFVFYVLFWALLEYSLMSFWTHFHHLLCLHHPYLSFSVCICNCLVLSEMTTEPDLLISAVLAKYAHFNHLTPQMLRAHSNPQRSSFGDLVDATSHIASVVTQSCTYVEGSFAPADTLIRIMWEANVLILVTQF